ncbi:MAG: iron ABC transporter permease [Actinomycetaceae bacterium]|nr:iron ABC transporter permease [Actinomycetaceae bacterium]
MPLVDKKHVDTIDVKNADFITVETDERTSKDRMRLVSLVSVIFTILVSVIALGVGDYYVNAFDVVKVLLDYLMRSFSFIVPNDGIESVEINQSVVILLVRMPRIALALLVGGGLAVAGGTLQAIFNNPLVSPDVIGVSSGASFGGVLAIVVGLGSIGVLAGAMVMGIVAVAIVLSFAALRASSPILTVVLGGVVTASFFQALVSLVTYLADPYTTLPAITFWLMGSLANASTNSVFVALIPVAIGFVIIFAVRWRINILALGDEDAQSLGVNPKRMRYLLISVVALIVASTVAVAGVVGWIGLVIPHLVRLLVGTDYRRVIPLSFIIGAGFLVFIDTIARTAVAGEIPLGVITALIGAPFFAYLLFKNRSQELGHA